ncbi:MAG: GNAT family N-acetyltransferase [Polyangiaceae bacterium]
MTRVDAVTIRAPIPGEGAAIAALWRELWDIHESWGGYPGVRDSRVYARLARRLDEDARVRAGQSILGRHVHLLAERGGLPCGQVEGWFDRLGSDHSTAFTCEVRSLVVTAHARRLGAGRSLLEALAVAARAMARGSPCVLAAEVLAPNPGHAFYTRVGFRPVSWTARIEARRGAALAIIPSMHARLAGPDDAVAVARLESLLASRRRAVGDLRFDHPRALDAALVDLIAAHLSGNAASKSVDPCTLVACDSVGGVRATATFAVHALEPPFIPDRRALVGRISADPSWPVERSLLALVALSSQMALARGAPSVEITDLTEPGTDLYDAALVAGGHPWSRVVIKPA